MKILSTFGRLTFCLSFIAFGLQNLILSDFIPGLEPVPPWLPLRSFLACLLGCTLTIAAALAGIEKKRTTAAIWLAILTAASFLLLHLPKLLMHPANGGVWTVAFETIAFLGIAILLAPPNVIMHPARRIAVSFFAPRSGRLCYGISLPVFGVLHFLYPAYIAIVIPAWIPAHWFWAYFIGVIFCLSGVSLATGIRVRLTSLLLGCMFGLWVVFLHAPRVAAKPYASAEWTSLFVALAMAGGAFLPASTPVSQDQKVP